MTADADTGLQAERTAMAWQRTALGFAGVSALTLRHAAGDPVLAVPGVVGLLAAVALLVTVEGRYLRTLAHVEQGRNPMGRGLVRTLAVGTGLLAVTAALVALGADGADGGQ